MLHAYQPLCIGGFALPAIDEAAKLTIRRCAFERRCEREFGEQVHDAVFGKGPPGDLVTVGNGSVNELIVRSVFGLP